MGVTSKKTDLSDGSTSMTAAAADPLAGTASPDDEREDDADEKLAAQCRFDNGESVSSADSEHDEPPDDSPPSNVDAGQIQLSEFQHRPPPAADGRANKFQVIFQPRVLD